jgi:hypothetical protein
MQLPAWLSQRHVAPLAIVRGGTVDALLGHMQTDRSPAITVVCERALGERLTAAAVLDRTMKPTIAITRGLVRDVDSIVVARAERQALLTAPVLEAYLAQERRRLVTRARMLADYPPSPAAVEQMVVDRAVRLLRTAAQRLVAPLLVHDAAYALPRTACAGLAVFEYPGAPAARDPGPAVPPPLGAITAHARFLATTGVDVLCEMHAPFAGSEAAALFDEWTAYLGVLDEAPETKPLADAARAALGHVRARMPDAVASTVKRGRPA